MRSQTDGISLASYQSGLAASACGGAAVWWDDRDQVLNPPPFPSPLLKNDLNDQVFPPFFPIWI